MPIKYIDIFLQFKVLYGKIIRSRWEMSLVVYNSLIEKIDGFFTELFSKLQETISWSSFWILVAGIVVGFVICSSIYSILLFKSINNQEEKIKANAFIASDELVQEIVENIKKSYVEDTEGLMVRERFEVLGSKLYLEINQIATLYYPTSKYPLYELTIEENEQIRERDFERLKYMTFYSTTNDCLRGFILRYFGGEKKAYCGKCSNCLSVHKLVDVTIDAQKIMSCIARTGQRYGKTVICDVLKGSKSEKILKAELNNQSTYGIMKEVTARHIFGTIDFLAEKEYISSDNETEVLKLLPKSRDVLFGRERLVMKKVENSEKVVKTHRPEVPVNSDLLDALKALRKSIASKKSVPAYVIFTDATLIDMCKKCPETPDEMLEVSGVGRTKLEKFGKQFLEEIAKFR